MKPFINQLQRLISFNIIIRSWHKFSWKETKSFLNFLVSTVSVSDARQHRRNQYEEVLIIFWVLYQKWSRALDLDSSVPTEMFIELWNLSWPRVAEHLIQVKLKVVSFIQGTEGFISKSKGMIQKIIQNISTRRKSMPRLKQLSVQAEKHLVVSVRCSIMDHFIPVKLKVDLFIEWTHKTHVVFSFLTEKLWFWSSQNKIIKTKTHRYKETEHPTLK